MALLDCVQLKYENMENKRIKPIRIRLPRAWKLYKPVKNEKFVPVISLRKRSISWIHDLSSKGK